MVKLFEVLKLHLKSVLQICSFIPWLGPPLICARQKSVVFCCCEDEELRNWGEAIVAGHPPWGRWRARKSHSHAGVFSLQHGHWLSDFWQHWDLVYWGIRFGALHKHFKEKLLKLLCKACEAGLPPSDTKLNFPTREYLAPEYQWLLVWFLIFSSVIFFLLHFVFLLSVIWSGDLGKEKQCRQKVMFKVT